MKTKLFKSKYSTGSRRLKGWNYSENGSYFLTICLKNRINYFGKIKDKKMILNQFGKIAERELLISSKIRKELILDKYIIMPNHIHCIACISNENIMVI
jgi:REP element-mobilizing transposase RayT